MTSDQGRFVLTRSDHVSVDILKPGVQYIVGRSMGLPAFQRLPSKYVSREQLGVCWNPPSLLVKQIGKNPTFFGPESQQVPRIDQPVLEFVGSADVTEPKVEKRHDGHTVVRLPLCDPIHAQEAPPLTQNTADTLFFPSEVGVPCIAVRCVRTQATVAETREGANAATSSLSTAQMLAVPTLAMGTDDGSDSDDGDSRGKRDSGRGADAGRGDGRASTGVGSRPQWQGLLDAAMQQRHQQETELQQQQQQEQETPRRPSAPLPPAPTSTPVPVAPPQEEATPRGASTSIVPAATTPPVSGPLHAAPKPKMGFWEWKCHANGPDGDAKSWRKYPLAVANLLEEAYQAKQTTVAVPDDLLLGGGGKKHSREDDKNEKGKGKAGKPASTYSVCFKEASLADGMIQYQNDDKGKFRVVRRTGGDIVDFSGVTAVHVIPQSSSEDEDDDGSSSSDESDFSESESESISSSSSSDSEERRKRKKAKKGRK